MMLQSGTKARLDAMEQVLQHRGYTFDEYLAVVGQSEHDLVSELSRQADRDARIDLALRAVGMCGRT